MTKARMRQEKKPRIKKYPFIGVRPTKEQRDRLLRLAKLSRRSMSELYVMAMERAMPAFEADAMNYSGKKI